MLLGPAFFWTFSGSIAIKWLSCTPSFRFGGGAYTELFWFRSIIKKIMRIYLIFILFQPNYDPTLQAEEGKERDHRQRR